jgi:hypothetical protein
MGSSSGLGQIIDIFHVFLNGYRTSWPSNCRPWFAFGRTPASSLVPETGYRKDFYDFLNFL